MILDYNPEIPKSGERCQLLRPTIYKILGTLSVIFTYIGKIQVNKKKLAFFH